MNSYRYGPAWQALGITTALLFVVLPILIVVNGEELDFTMAAVSVLFVCLGLWCVFYFRQYSIVLDQERFTVRRLARSPLRIAWCEVVSVSSNKNELVLRTNDGGKLKISVHFPGYSAIEAAAAANLPEAAYGGVGKPFVEAPTADPGVLRERHYARKRMWLRMSRKSFGISVVLASAAWLASVALRHAGFGSVPEPFRTLVLWVLAFAKAWGYGMAVWMALMAVLLLIMFVQEAWRFGRGMPPAV